MNFSGRNLELVRGALDLALDELHNMIATCPDPHDPDNAAEIAELEATKHKIRNLILRIEAKSQT